MIGKMIGSLAVLAGALGLASMTGAQPSQQAATAKEVNITGVVTCSKYVGTTPQRKGFTAAEAIRMCASQGFPYVIVDGKNVYPLEGDKNQLAKLAGEKVTVVGHVVGGRPEGAAEAYQETVSATSIRATAN